jgi:hypothetical protein
MGYGIEHEYIPNEQNFPKLSEWFNKLVIEKTIHPYSVFRIKQELFKIIPERGVNLDIDLGSDNLSKQFSEILSDGLRSNEAPEKIAEDFLNRLKLQMESNNIDQLF